MTSRSSVRPAKSSSIRRTWLRSASIRCRPMCPRAICWNGADVSAEFPLVLQTGLGEKTYHHSRFREQAWARKVSPDPVVYVHPETAAQYGVAEADWITVRTPGASGSCRLQGQADHRYDARCADHRRRVVAARGAGAAFRCARRQHQCCPELFVVAGISASGSADTRGIACRIEFTSQQAPSGEPWTPCRCLFSSA